MNALPRTHRNTAKGEATREVILNAGVALAREIGVAGLSIGALADKVGMSKSGLFAHFGAKEDLQLAVLQAAMDSYAHEVLAEAFKLPRGLARLRGVFTRSLAWSSGQAYAGGCPLIAAAIEFDDRPGAVRDFLAAQQLALMQSIARCVTQVIECGDLAADTDPSQFSFEMLGLQFSATHHYRILQQQRFMDAALWGFERLLQHPPVKTKSIQTQL